MSTNGTFCSCTHLYHSFIKLLPDREVVENNRPNIAATIAPAVSPTVVQHAVPTVSATPVLVVAVICELFLHRTTPDKVLKILTLAIPAQYLDPPVLDPEEWPPGRYVITRGRHVGIFTDW